MKAQYVFENIEFERGVEPKKAMGIGLDDETIKWVNIVTPILKPIGYELYSLNSSDIMEFLKKHPYGKVQYNWGNEKNYKANPHSDSFKALWNNDELQKFVILEKNPFLNTWGFRVINLGVDTHNHKTKIMHLGWKEDLIDTAS